MKIYKKVAFIGLDGVPYSMVRRLMDLGVTPTLKKFADHGFFTSMETSLPPVSSVAWTSFMTGTNPGNHGIFGFTDVEPNRITLKLPSFDDLGCNTFWKNHPEKRALIINLPFTYPARPLNGKLICGFVAPIFERAVYPESLIPWLKSLRYSIDSDNVRARTDRNFLIKNLFQNLEILKQVSLTLMKDYWDLLILVITGTDRLHHFLYDAFDDDGHFHHADFLNYYGAIDSFLSVIDSMLDDHTLRVFLSDHGFTQLKTQVYLNNLLKSLGYLKFIKNDPKSINDVHPSSQAFAMDATRIFINTFVRFGNPIMPESRVSEITAKIKYDLENIKVSDLGFAGSALGLHGDQRLFQSVKFRNEVYSGYLMKMAPDLVVIPNRGIDVKATVGVKDLISRDIFTGMHTHDDAFLLIHDPDYSGFAKKAHIESVANLLPWSGSTIVN